MSKSFLAIALSSFSILLFFQNCGDVMVAQMELASQVPVTTVTTKESPPTTFSVPETRDYIMRVAFLVDMSASMQTKGCGGTGSDFDADDCSRGDIGYDPFFNRLVMIDAWIRQVDDYLLERGLPPEKLEMAFIPFSMSNGVNDPLAVNGTINYLNTIQVHLNQKTFTSNRQRIRDILDSYRRMYYARFETPPSADKLNPAWGLSPTMANFAEWHQAGTAYIKTSIPAPAMDVMLNSINQELIQLQGQSADALAQTRFEVVFLSDGVAKPHSEDIRRTFELFWQARTILRDYRGGYSYLRDKDKIMCGEQSSYRDLYCEFREVNLSLEGSKCSQNCRQDIDTLITTGQRLPNTVGICRTCIDSLLDYQSTPVASEGGPPIGMSLPAAAKFQWGDWQLNGTLNIQRGIKAIDYLFKTFPQVEFRFNFVRFNNPSTQYKIPDALLTLDRNWLSQAKAKYRSQHRHTEVTSSQIPFALFPGQVQVNGYKLSQFFLVNPQARLNNAGRLAIDSDADGLFDEDEAMLNDETKFNFQKSRTNNVCIDVIVQRTSSCITLGCDPQVDLDGDGLNQCEENTVSTEDSDFDSDNDGISDYFEVIYGFNPLIDDRKEDSNSDGTSNFVNFTLGAGPWTKVNDVDPSLKVQVNIREAEPIAVSMGSGETAYMPTYTFKLLNLPTVGSLQAQGWGDTFMNVAKQPMHLHTPSIVPSNYMFNENRVMLMGRVDHAQSYGDVFWIYKPITVPYKQESNEIMIDLQEMPPMPWLDTVGETNP